jgi:hypothetical protein
VTTFHRFPCKPRIKPRCTSCIVQRSFIYKELPIRDFNAYRTLFSCMIRLWNPQNWALFERNVLSPSVIPHVNSKRLKEHQKLLWSALQGTPDEKSIQCFRPVTWLQGIQKAHFPFGFVTDLQQKRLPSPNGYTYDQSVQTTCSKSATPDPLMTSLSICDVIKCLQSPIRHYIHTEERL